MDSPSPISRRAALRSAGALAVAAAALDMLGSLAFAPERVLAANYLVPPRRHRAFPLIELLGRRPA